jgi:hypothetical protein
MFQAREVRTEEVAELASVALPVVLVHQEDLDAIGPVLEWRAEGQVRPGHSCARLRLNLCMDIYI